MPPKRAPKEIAAEAETHLRICHNALRVIRDSDQTVLDPDPLSRFQSHVARTLYALENAVLDLKIQIKRYEASFMAHTPEANSGQQIRNLRTHISALEQLIDYGRNLGDAFAWLFYRKDHEQLRRHYAHPRIKHTAVGTGGLGEVIFADHFPKMNDHLVVHHNLTTFLRIGDFSLVNLASGTIDGLGELKTKKNADNSVTVEVSIVGKKSSLGLPKLPGVPIGPAAPPEEPALAFSARRQRQVKAMREAFRSPAVLTGIPLPIDQTPRQLIFDPYPLVPLFDASTPTAASLQVPSPGVRLLGIKSPYASLTAQAFNDQPIDTAPIIGEAMKDIRSLILPDSPWNAVETSFLIYPTHDRYNLAFGHTPPMWWPIRQDVIDALVDRSFLVQCFFNPAFLLTRLEKQGYTIHRRSPRAPLILEVAKDKAPPLCFGGLDYFLEQAARRLVTEDSVFAMIVGIVEEMKQQDLPPHAKVKLHLSFRR